MNDLNQIVVFRLGSELYGVSIADVKEIVTMTTISKVPQLPEYVEGITNLRGNIYVIHNLRTRFNMENKEINDKTKIIVLNEKKSRIYS